MPPLNRRELLAAALGTTACSLATAAVKPREKKQDWHEGEFRRLVALGESTTAGGWSTNASRCWVSVLGRLINDFQSRRMDVINNGIGSNVISTKSVCYPASGKPAATERLQKHVIDHRPDLLIISYGLNDARGGTPLPLFQQELAGVIRTVRKKIQPLWREAARAVAHGQRARAHRQRPARLVSLRRQRHQLHRALLSLGEPVRRVVRLPRPRRSALGRSIRLSTRSEDRH